MMARIRTSLDENQKGFTLVELLVVVIIIGILAAIAIPVYLGQQSKARESAAKADLATAKTALVVYAMENPAYDPADNASLPNGFASTNLSGLKIANYDKDAGTFCLQGTAAGTTDVYSVRNTGAIAKAAC